MERALTYITLDVQKIDSGVLIKAKRGDSARRLVVSLTSRGRPYIPGEGVTAVFYERKPDGNPCFNAADIDGCTVTYDFTGQTTNVVGLAACEIRLYDAQNHLLTSPRFELLVDDTEYQEGDVPDSSPEFTALTEMVSKGTALIEGLELIRESLQFTAADAGKLLMVAGDGSVVPVVVGPGLEIVGGVLRLSGDVVIPDDPGADETTAELGVARLGLIILGKE